MPERILFPEYRNELEPTRYPFADVATLHSPTFGEAIEIDTFLDASVHIIGAGAEVRLAQVDVSPTQVTIWLGDAARPKLASADFDPLDPPDMLELQDSLGRAAGVLVSEALRLTRFSAWPVGEHSFPRGASEFVASCVIPTPELGVRGILVGPRLLTGDVWLVGERGVVLRSLGDCEIRMDVVGDPLFLRTLCEPVELFEPPRFVRTINNCAPDANGDFQLTVGDHQAPGGATIVRINPTDIGLRIEAIGSRLRSE